MKIVIWSGGADSTLLLHDALLVNPRGVVALTLDHTQVNDRMQRHLQYEARCRYLSWVRKTLGYRVDSRVIKVVLSKDAGAVGDVGQHGLFLAHLFPYMVGERGTKNEVQFGYIRGDDFWHWRTAFRKAFDGFASVAYSELELSFPLEWTRKKEVLERLTKAKVPDNAWWTCDRPKSRRACGKCIKCEAIR